jgi:NAD(P)-dependent dehydrogenase (short-subunit alcohol dehydrogenase family)
VESAGSIAFVSGANRGIGKAFVEGLVSAGARKVYAGARETESLAGLVSRFGDVVVPVGLDVTDEASVAAAAAKANDVNLLVNNAGVARGGGVADRADFAGAREEMLVNYFGLLNMGASFAGVLRRNGPSAMVNVLSILGLIGSPRVATYSASKAAALAATRAIRAELHADRVLVVGVMPGFVDTDMTAGLQASKMDAADVVLATLAALRSHTEDVYPGEQAAHLAESYFAYPKATELTMSATGSPAQAQA